MMHLHRSERTFIMLSVALLVVFGIALAVTSIVFGIQVPTPQEKVDPRTVATPGVSNFGLPVEERVREVSPGKYEVWMLAGAFPWKFSPGSTRYGEPPVRVPVGAEVTFYVTSMDVQHGFKVQDTNISVMILPGEVSRVTTTFDEARTHNLICHEYCGTGHQGMYGILEVYEE